MGRITFNKAVEHVYDDYTAQRRRTLDEVKRRVRVIDGPLYKYALSRNLRSKEVLLIARN